MEGRIVKYKVDEGLCSGHGRCHTAASDVYELDYEGYNSLRGKGLIDVSPGQEDAALSGQMACPEAAIELIGD
jgi:ferredoxin